MNRNKLLKELRAQHIEADRLALEAGDSMHAVAQKGGGPNFLAAQRNHARLCKERDAIARQIADLEAQPK
ncbi:hypothetical protein D3C72_2343000 [compost metagenome]